MSFWDDVKHVAQSLPVVGNAALSVVDIAKSIGDHNDNKSLKDKLLDDYGVPQSANALQAGLGHVEQVPGVNQTLQGLAKAYSYGAARPISTAAQQLTAGENAQFSTVFGSKGWRDAWNTSRQLSPGQALITAFATAEDNQVGSNTTFAKQLGTTKAGTDWTPQDWARIASHGEKHLPDGSKNPNFNQQFSLASGTVDSLLSWYTDPTVVAGKATKFAKLDRLGPISDLHPTVIQAKKGDLAALAAEDATGLTGRGARVRSQVDNFITQTDGYSESQLMRFKSFQNNAPLAAAFAASDGNPALKRLVLRATMGDQQAVQQLVSQRVDIAGKLSRLSSEIDDTIFADELAPEGSLFEFNNQQADLDQLMAEKKANERILDFYNRILPDQEAAREAIKGAQFDTHTLGAVGSVVDVPGISKADRTRLAQESSYIIQDGIGDVPVRFARQSLGRRPEGMIDLHDPEQGFQELSNMLHRVRGMDSESRRKMLDSYVRAPDDNARMLVVQHIETAAFEHIADSLGYHPEDAKVLLSKTMDERGRIVQHIKERAFSGATGEDGVPVDAIRAEDGTLYHRPLLETHLADRTPTLDVDHIYRVLKHNSERYGALKAGAGETWDVMKDFGTQVNDLWKFTVLLRLGYFQRNVLDSQFRLMGYMGGLDYIRTMGQNVKQGVGFKLSAVKGAALRQHMIEEHDNVVRQIEAKLDGRPIDQKMEDDPEIAALLERKDQLATSIEQGINPDDIGAQHFGQGPIKVGAYTRPDAFGGSNSEYERYREQVSGETMWRNFAGGEADRALAKYRSDEWVTLTGEDHRYADHYLRVTNQQFRNSQIAMRLLRGDSPEKVTAWLKSDEGRAIRRRLVHRWDSPEELVAANVQNINHVVPDPMMQRMLHERPFRAGDIDRMFHGGQHTRPPINAAQVGWSLGIGKAAQAYERLRGSYFKWMSSMPDNVMGRHPMYRQMYRGRLKQLIDNADPEMTATLSPEMQRVFDEQARNFARREMKRYMFDVSSKSNMSHWMRFMSPFFAAWEDTLTKYGRLIMRDPSLVPHAWKVWTSANNSSLFDVVDINGNPVPADRSTLSDNEYIRIPASFLGKQFSQGLIDIPKSSINIVLQGDPWWLPGFGPMVQAPVNSIAKTRPSVAQAMSFVLPYGAQDSGKFSWRTFLNSSLRTASKGQDDRSYSRMLVQVALTEAQRYQTGERTSKPSPQEIADRTRKLWMLKIVSGSTMPFSLQFKSPYQFYIDEAHRYQQKYGEKGDQKFLEKYGEDYYKFTTSLSKNVTGVQATGQAYKASQKVKGLIAQHPDYGWFFVGPDNTGTFNQNVYTAQNLEHVSPTSPDTFRGVYTPDQAIARNNADLGWTEYQKLSAQLEAIRISRGLPSMEVKGAEDLRQIKQAWLQQVTDPKNGPAWGQDWYNDYQARDEGTTRKFLQAAQAAVKDPTISKRPDIQTMGEYIQARDQFQKLLAARKANGGSASLTAQSNSDLAEIWGKVTGILIDQNVTFADVFSRSLENDDLTARI